MESDIIDILINIPIFQELKRKDLEKIVPLLKPITYPSNTRIIKEGARGTSMYVIKKGTVKITRTGSDGEEIFIGNQYSGSYFGEFSLIDNLPRSAHVTSIEETEIFQLNKQDFDKVLYENDMIAKTFYKNCLTETFSRFRDTVSNFTFSQHNLKEKSAELDEINKDLSLAKKLQGYFINTDFLEKEQISENNIKHSYIYYPCIAIGGDFLNVVTPDKDQISIIIADVQGHGIAAALATGALKSAFSIKIQELYEKPIELMKFLNKHFIEIISQLFATCYYASINTEKRKIAMAKAGHHHPLFWKKRLNNFIEIQCMGTGLGIIAEPKFGQVELDYEAGDKILFFTDGIIEQMNDKKEMYSKARLESKVGELIKRGEKEILKKLFLDLKEFAQGTQFDDDVTLLLFEF
jgi:serine phosphatase RsbU (regulator of sigma subunit)